MGLGLRLSKVRAVRLETEILAEERHHMVLEAIRGRTGVSAYGRVRFFRLFRIG